MQDLIRPDASFTPRELFARMQGAWLEPRLDNMWQENYGANLVTTTGQTVGLLLDKSQRTVLGLETITDPTFSVSVGDFIAPPGGSATLSWDPSGALQVNVTGIGGGFARNQSVIWGLTVGSWYQIDVVMRKTTYTGTLACSIGGVLLAPIISLGANYALTTLFFQSLGATPSMVFSRSAGATGIFFVDSISVRLISGNHASQATAANRPIYQLDSKNLPYLAHDSTDSLSVSLPNLSGGVFSSAGSVYFSTPQGMSCLHNQSIGTSYNLPAPQTDNYCTVITPSRLVPPLEKRLELYMLHLAGLVEPDYLLDDNKQQLTDDSGELLLRA